MGNSPDIAAALDAFRWLQGLSGAQSRLLAALDPYRRAVDLCAHMFENSDALRDGELVITERKLTELVRAHVADERVQALELRLRAGHVLPVMEVARLGMRWSWANAYRLTAAELNPPVKALSFAARGRGRIRPLNLLAKGARLLPGLLLDGGLITRWLGEALLDHIAGDVIYRNIEGAAVAAGVRVDGDTWHLEVSGGDAPSHPAFQTVSLGVLGEWRILGDVIVVRGVEVRDGAIAVRLGLHANVFRLSGMVESARSLLAPKGGGAAPKPAAPAGGSGGWAPRLDALRGTVKGLRDALPALPREDSADAPAPPPAAPAAGSGGWAPRLDALRGAVDGLRDALPALPALPREDSADEPTIEGPGEPDGPPTLAGPPLDPAELDASLGPEAGYEPV